MAPPRPWVCVALLILGIAVAAVPAGAQKTSPARSAGHLRTTAAAAVASDVGQWGPVLNWPLVSVHSVLQPSGQVLVWDGFSNGPNSQRLWDPSSGTFIPVPNANNIFCAGQLALADGRTIVVGGHISPNVGLTQTNLFDPATKTWTRGADMSKARWYPTGTTLGDGRVLVVSGDSITQDNTPPINPLSLRSNDVPEIYNPRVNSWTSLPSAARAMPLYPFMFQLPDGRVLDAGPEQQSRTLNLASGTWTNLALSPFDGHSAVMYRPGKVLKTGKWSDPDFKDLIVHGRAAVLDTTVATPAWREVAPMAFPRSYHTLVALPDGNVMAMGGDRTSEGTILANGVLTPELWNATTETWTSMAPMQTSREYHSTALLLPDARILVSGGGALPGSATDQTSAEVYSPPYLFKGPRPTITAAPTTVQYTTNFSVSTPDASRIASVALLRTPAVTHAFDQNQRYVPLTFTATSSGLDVKAPANGNIAPPGYYMLFIVDTNGVPSVASFVRLPAPWEDTVAPSAPTGLTATNGQGSIGLMWTPAIDNIAVTGYDIHRSTTPSFVPSTANRVAQTTLNTFTDTGLAPGTYYYVVVARDAAGNSSAPSNVAFASATAETVPPTVSISAPAGGATVAGVVPVTANASDNVALAGVSFFADGSAVGAEDTTAPYSADWNTRGVANGNHVLTAVARDAAGNTATSAAVTVTVNNTGSSGLVAAYSFDDVGATVPDSSGNGNGGTPSGAVWTAQGQFDGALSFDGVDDWVTVADSASLDLTDAMTLEAWVRPVRLSGIWRTLLLKEQPGNLLYGLYAGTDTSVPDAVVYANGAGNEAAGSSQLPLNTWSHLAATYDGAAMRLYVNGTLAASTPLTGSMPSSDGALRIGGNGVWGEYYEGLIDEVRVYGRALTAAEIQTDMNTPVTPPPPPPPPADTTPPTAPAGLSAAGSLGSVTLSWSASSDDVGVVHYNVHRSTTAGFTPSAANLIAQPNGTSYTDAGLAPGVYFYRVTAADAAGNVSASSAEASGDASDRTPPSAPASLSATGSVASVSLSWSAATDNVAVVRYNVHRSTVSGFVPSAANRIAQVAGTSFVDAGLVAGVYYYKVTAEDAAGNISTPSPQAVGNASDTTPPSAPSGLTATGSPGTIRLAWTASTDDVGIAGYDVYRSTFAGFIPSAANRIAHPTGTSYTDSGLTPGTYYYRVTATDGAGNVSPFSAEASASSADTSAPTAPQALAAAASVGTVSLSWSASTDNVGVVGYNVYRSTTAGFAPSAANRIAQPTGTSYTNSGLAPGTYYYRVTAVDGAGNVSPASNEASATVADTSAPTAPATLTATGSPGTISLSWSASTDNVGVAGYDVYRSTVPGFIPSAADRIAHPTGTSYTDTGLSAGVYYYRVAAVDAAGNVSPLSAEASATAGDTAPPSAPAALTATGSAGTVSLSWSAATDDVGVAGYDVYRSVTPGFTPSAANRVAEPPGTSYTDTGLAAGTYYYRVTAADAAGNVSAPSVEVSASVPDSSPPSAPEGLAATGSMFAVTLSWSASTDDVGVVRYNVHRSVAPIFVPDASNLVAQPAGTSYTDSALAPGVYYYLVTAVDGAGNVSPASESVTGIAAGDTSAPSAPTRLSATSSFGRVELAWSASSDDVGVVRYRVHRSQSPGFVPDASNLVAQPTGLSYSDSALAPGLYYYVVTAEDAAGNVSAPSAEATGDAATDNAAPSAPGALSAVGSLGTVALSWEASSDDVGVVQYNVHRSQTAGFVPDASNLVAQPTGASYTDLGLAPGVYYYRVTAQDARGNVSAPSAVATADASDRLAPAAPEGLSVTISPATVSLAWTAPSDNVGVVSYNVHRSTTQGFTPTAANRIAQPAGTEYTDSGLAPGTYYYVVTAEDAAGNVSSASIDVTGTVLDTSAPSAPGDLAATGSLFAVALSWSPSSDDVGVVRYRVHRSESPGFVPDASNLVAQPTGTRYEDSGLAPGTYYYVVTAEDDAGNVSVSSAEVAGVAAADTTAPSAPEGLSATGSLGSAALSWSASSDNVGVVRYNVHRSQTAGFVPDASNLVAQPTGTSYTDSALAPGTYYYRVTAEDARGNVSAPSAEATADASDRLAPAAPEGLSVTISPATVSLAWTAPSDNVGVVSYNVHRSTTQGFTPTAANRIAQPTDGSYTDTELAPGTYYYVVTAEDAAGNVGIASTEAAGTVLDTSAPSAPAGLEAIGSLFAVALTWSASSDDIGVAQYNVHRSQTPGFTPDAANLIANTSGTSYQDSALAPGAYYYVVTAEDDAGNVSVSSAEVAGIAADDTTAPSAPEGLSATGSFASVALSWSASSDNVGVVRYNVHRSQTAGFVPDASNLVAQPTGTSYTDSGLAPGTYYYRVTAEDARGNVSVPSAEATGSASDTVAPTAPQGLTTAVSPRTVSLAWTASSDNVGVVSYNVHRSTTQGFAPTAANRIAQPAESSYSDSGLAPGTYYYRVTAEDAAGNVSSASAEATGTVLDTSPPSAPGGLAATGSLFVVSLSWGASSDDIGVAQYNVHRSQTPGFAPSASNLVANTNGTSYEDSALAPGTYYYVVTAEDDAGNVSVPSEEISGIAAADTTAPSAPEALSANASPGTVNLSWGASSDNVTVVHYNVHRSSSPAFAPNASNRIAQPTGTSYTDSGLAPGTYYYRVTAEDAAGNLSASSAEVSGIAADLTAPVVALLSPAVGSSVIGSIAVSASASDNVGVAGVQFKLDGVELGAEDTVAPYSVTWDTRQTTDGQHVLTAAARDAARNVSTSAPVGVTVDNLQGLVAAYSFDAGSGTTVADVSGNGNTGVISNTTWSPNGRFGQAMLFDNFDMVSVPDSNSLDLAGAMTIEGWVRASQTGGFRTLAVKEGPGSVVYGLYAATRTSSPGGDVGPTGDVMIGGTEILARGVDKMLPDVWNHLAVTFDGTTLRVYQDGNLIASRLAPGAITTSSGALRIGGNTVRSEFFRGLIDEIRIYKRALTAAEIRADMNVPVGQ